MKSMFIYVIGVMLLSGCSKEQTHEERDAPESITEESPTRYTCPMHPQVMQDIPGSCPICGMNLVSVDKTDSSSADLMLTDSQIRLANISTQRVLRKEIGQHIIINGRLTVDQQKSQIISSRAAGRIEKLFIRETGQHIHKGQALYVLYSELLLTLQQEYLLAKEQYESLGHTEKRYKSFLDAAEGKLLLYGLTKNQIARLTDESAIQPRITFLAPASGTVTEVSVSEGAYVQEGAALYNLEDISSLWVEAELYPNEIAFVEKGDRVQVRVSGVESQPIEAEITFMSPEYRNNTQITIIRAAIENRDNTLTPGQHVQIYLTHSAHEALAVPIDAVIRDGKGSHVYLQRGNNTFSPRIVKTGFESFDQIEITEGITEGDTIAASGAYLLYSEMVLKRGADPTADPQHRH